MILVPKSLDGSAGRRKKDDVATATTPTVVADDTPEGCIRSSNSDMRNAIRTILKQMVKRAVMPSPVRHVFGLDQLERAHSILQQMAFNASADSAIGLTAVRGLYCATNLLKNRTK